MVHTGVHAHTGFELSHEKMKKHVIATTRTHLEGVLQGEISQRRTRELGSLTDTCHCKKLNSATGSRMVITGLGEGRPGGSLARGSNFQVQDRVSSGVPASSMVTVVNNSILYARKL